MSREFLPERERALENEFFYRVDEKLREQLREKLRAERTRAQLAAETGICDEAVLNDLVESGITTETLMALALVPLVQVAWADRVMDNREKDAILKAAASKGHEPQSPSYQLLEQWLSERPSENLMRCWKEYVKALCRTMTPEKVQALRDELLAHARDVAESAGGILSIGAISQEEQAVLDELTAAFAADE